MYIIILHIVWNHVCSVVPLLFFDLSLFKPILLVSLEQDHQVSPLALYLTPLSPGNHQSKKQVAIREPLP